MTNDMNSPSGVTTDEKATLSEYSVAVAAELTPNRYPFAPETELIALATDAELDVLGDSIAKNGLFRKLKRDPVTGLIVDGRGRYLASLRRGITITEDMFEDITTPIAGKTALLDYVMEINLSGSGRTTGQRAAAALKYHEECDKCGQPVTIEQAAKKAGVSAGTLYKLKRVAKNAPALAVEIAAGKSSVHGGEHASQSSPEIKESYLKHSRAGDRAAARAELKPIRAAKSAQVSSPAIKTELPAPSTTKKFLEGDSSKLKRPNVDKRLPFFMDTLANLARLEVEAGELTELVKYGQFDLGVNMMLLDCLRATFSGDGVLEKMTRALTTLERTLDQAVKKSSGPTARLQNSEAPVDVAVTASNATMSPDDNQAAL